MAKFFLILVIAVAVRAQDSDCPEKNGVFADSTQCDRYYECNNFVLTEKLCPDGLVFADLSTASGAQGRCDYPFNVDCGDRPELQPANSTTNCPRMNGYYKHEDARVCNQFFFCSAGQANLITCPDGLVFSEKTGTCSWPGEANRVGCQSSDVVQFDCPAQVQDAQDAGPLVTNPLFADPTDCQYFYVCINGVEPRRNGCTNGLVFNDLTKRCDKPKNVPDCKDWYKNAEGEEEDDDIEIEDAPRPKPKRPIVNRS